MEALYQLVGTALVWIFMLGFGGFGIVYFWEKVAVHMTLYQERKELADFITEQGLRHQFATWAKEREKQREHL
jgi:hypothetical protein